MDFGGGCSLKKAMVFAELIRRFSLKCSVDIGVYRGRSFFPQAIAHQRSGKGMVYGVDPFSNDLAREKDTPLSKQIDEFLAVTDFPKIYQTNVERIATMKLDQHAKLLRMPSANAARYFRDHNIKVDLVHIDGNHDREIAMEDLRNYMSLLTPRGFIVLDDISWDSVKGVYDLAKSQMRLILECMELPNDDFAVLWCGPSEEVSMVKSKLGL
jgi:hypothetical protein